MARQVIDVPSSAFSQGTFTVRWRFATSDANAPSIGADLMANGSAGKFLEFGFDALTRDVGDRITADGQIYYPGRFVFAADSALTNAWVNSIEAITLIYANTEILIRGPNAPAEADKNIPATEFWDRTNPYNWHQTTPQEAWDLFGSGSNFGRNDNYAVRIILDDGTDVDVITSLTGGLDGELSGNLALATPPPIGLVGVLPSQLVGSLGGPEGDLRSFVLTADVIVTVGAGLAGSLVGTIELGGFSIQPGDEFLAIRWRVGADESGSINLPDVYGPAGILLQWKEGTDASWGSAESIPFLRDEAGDNWIPGGFERRAEGFDQYVIAGLVNGRTYQVRAAPIPIADPALVRVADIIAAIAEGDWSEILTGAPVNPRPSVVLFLTLRPEVMGFSSSWVSPAFEGVDDDRVMEYQLEWSITGEYPALDDPSELGAEGGREVLPQTITNYSVKPLRQGTWHVRARAVNMAGPGDVWAEGTVGVEQVVEPGKPIITHVVTGNGMAMPKWNPPETSSITEHKMDRGDGNAEIVLYDVQLYESDVVPTDTNPPPIHSSPYLHRERVERLPQGRYSTRVRAINRGNNRFIAGSWVGPGEWSDPNLNANFAVYRNPTYPIGLTARIRPTGDAIEVTWREPTSRAGDVPDLPVLSYEVQWALVGESWDIRNSAIVSRDGDDPPPTFFLLEVDDLVTPYRFRVRAWNAVGASGWRTTSPTAAGEISSPGPPVDPSLFVNNNLVVVGWNSPITTGGAAIVGYQLALFQDGDDENNPDVWRKIPPDGVVTATLYQIGLAPDSGFVRYRIAVRATNMVGTIAEIEEGNRWSEWSVVVDQQISRTESPKPNAVPSSSLSLVSPSPGSLYFEYGEAASRTSPIVAYRIQWTRGTTFSTTDPSAVVPALPRPPRLWHFIQGLAAGSYSVRVSAIVEEGTEGDPTTSSPVVVQGGSPAPLSSAVASLHSSGNLAVLWSFIAPPFGASPTGFSARVVSVDLNNSQATSTELSLPNDSSPSSAQFPTASDGTSFPLSFPYHYYRVFVSAFNASGSGQEIVAESNILTLIDGSTIFPHWVHSSTSLLPYFGGGRRSVHFLFVADVEGFWTFALEGSDSPSFGISLSPTATYLTLHQVVRFTITPSTQISPSDLSLSITHSHSRGS